MASNKAKAVTSGMDIEKQSFIWTIHNFDVITKSKDQELIGNQEFRFSAGETTGLKTEWMVYVTLEKKKKDSDVEEEEEWIGCTLIFYGCPANPSVRVLAKWIAKVRSSCQDPYFDDDISSVDGIVTNCFCSGGSGSEEESHLPKVAKLENLSLRNGSLVIELAFLIYTPKKATISKDPASIQERHKPKFTEKLQLDLTKLLDSPSEHSEVIVKIVMEDGLEFRVASDVLSARSQVFKKMFESDMSESKTGIVKITDISSKTMGVVLRFLYTGTLHQDWRDADVITELVYSAGKYQLLDLLEFLDEVIGSVYTKETAGKLFCLVRKLSMKTAERDLWEFMKQNISTFDDMLVFTKNAEADATILPIFKSDIDTS